MGLLSQVFIQAVITSCVLGALKRAGVIRCARARRRERAKGSEVAPRLRAPRADAAVPPRSPARNRPRPPPQGGAAPHRARRRARRLHPGGAARAAIRREQAAGVKSVSEFPTSPTSRPQVDAGEAVAAKAERLLREFQRK